MSERIDGERPEVVEIVARGLLPGAEVFFRLGFRSCFEAVQAQPKGGTLDEDAAWEKMVARVTESHQRADREAGGSEYLG